MTQIMILKRDTIESPPLFPAVVGDGCVQEGGGV